MVPQCKKEIILNCCVFYKMYFPQPDDAEKTASLYFNVMLILYEKVQSLSVMAAKVVYNYYQKYNDSFWNYDFIIFAITKIGPCVFTLLS